MTSPDVSPNAYTNAPEHNPNLILGSLQLLFWLLFRPLAWRNHLARIERARYADTDGAKRPQWQNVALWRLLLEGYLVLPLAINMLLGLVLWGLGESGEKVVTRAANGIAYGVAFGFGFGTFYSLAIGIGVSLAVSVAYSLTYGWVYGIVVGFALGLAGDLLVSSSFGSGVALAAFLTISITDSVAVGAAYGLAIEIAFTLNLWRPLLLYPFTRAWNALIYILEKQDDNRLPSLLRYHSAFWDELEYLPLVGLKDLIALVATLNPTEAEAAIKHIEYDRRRLHWLVEPGRIALQIELSVRRLESCVYLENIQIAYQGLPIVESKNTARDMLLFFSRISQKIDSALNQKGYWSQRGALKLVSNDLERLFSKATRPRNIGNQYNSRFLHIAHYWCRITNEYIDKLVEQDALRLEICADLETIRALNIGVAAEESQDPASHFLRGFIVIRDRINNSLNQGSAYNQRLSLKDVEEKLESLLRDFNLSRSSNKYAPRFSTIATHWRKIVTEYIDKLAEEVELRQEIQSPYITGIPLTEEQKIFVGREDISTRIERLLLDRRRQPLLLYGQRRMGKTSLLYNLGRLLPNNITSLFVDLQGPATRASNNAGFLYSIAGGVLRSARAQSGLTLPPLDRSSLEADPFTAFDEWLDKVEEALGQNTALLALDEFEALEGAIAKGRFDPEEVLGMLRNLIQHRHRFKVLLAGSHAIEEFQSWASYLINVQVVKIGYLKESEARQLVERPVKDFALRYEPDAVERVLHLTRCHPFLVQLLCEEIVALKNEQDPAVRRLATFADVEAAARAASSSGSFFFADIQNQASALGAEVLRFMAARGEGAIIDRSTLSRQFASDLDSTLDRLLRRELIEAAGNGYRFQVESIRRWFA